MLNLPTPFKKNSRRMPVRSLKIQTKHTTSSQKVLWIRWDEPQDHLYSKYWVPHPSLWSDSNSESYIGPVQDPLSILCKSKFGWEELLHLYPCKEWKLLIDNLQQPFDTVSVLRHYFVVFLSMRSPTSNSMVSRMHQRNFWSRGLPSHKNHIKRICDHNLFVQDSACPK